MRSLDDELAVLHAVFGNVVAVEGVIFSCAVGTNLAFHYLHNAALLVFKLLCIIAIVVNIKNRTGCIRNSCLNVTAVFLSGINSCLKITNVVKSVENSQNIDTVINTLFYKIISVLEQFILHIRRKSESRWNGALSGGHLSAKHGRLAGGNLLECEGIIEKSTNRFPVKVNDIVRFP